jgi:hypothetical protein
VWPGNLKESTFERQRRKERRQGYVKVEEELPVCQIIRTNGERENGLQCCCKSP